MYTPVNGTAVSRPGFDVKINLLLLLLYWISKMLQYLVPYKTTSIFHSVDIGFHCVECGLLNYKIVFLLTVVLTLFSFC